jgi:AraC-like DNA-binding protein
MIRRPHIALRPFIKSIWISDQARPHLLSLKENALPDGFMHLVIRLTDVPIRIADAVHPGGHSYGYGVIGGARAGFYTRELSGPTRAIGATLLPGAARGLFGTSALEFANRHTSLSDVWGAQVDALRQRLLEIHSPDAQLELFEAYLLTKSPQVKGMHPAVAQALANTQMVSDVGSWVSNSGFSHRRFIELFGHDVGLTPKRFARVIRFQRMLKLLSKNPTASWAYLACDAGYSDQAHFNREFREFAGLTPEAYKQAAPDSPGHVPLLGDRTRR